MCVMVVGGLQWEKAKGELLVPRGLSGETGRLSVLQRGGSECLRAPKSVTTRLPLFWKAHLT